MSDRRSSWEERLQRLEAALADQERLTRIARRLEQRQSEIIGVLVEAGFWEVDPSSGRSTSADGHADADGRGSEGGGSERPCPARNPRVRQESPRWKGKSFKGAHFSDCPPDYLRGLAGYLNWCGERDEEAGALTGTGKPRAPFLFDDAKLARAWAHFNEARGQR